MGSISFDAFYARFMPLGAGRLVGDPVRLTAKIIAEGVAISKNGISLGQLYEPFIRTGLSLDCFLMILAGLEAAGRVHDRGDGIVRPGFPVPREARRG